LMLVLGLKTTPCLIGPTSTLSLSKVHLCISIVTTVWEVWPGKIF
jgi:hypothetical protein